MRRLVVLLLLLPTAAASHASVLDAMHVRALEDARWTDASGTERVGVLGDGTSFITVEDVATLTHPDLDQCYGKGYTRLPPGPAVEGPGNGFSPLAGHGTWTAAAVCASGEASSGHYRGLAPNTKVLTYFGMAEDDEKRAHQQALLDEFHPLVVTSSTLRPVAEDFLPLSDGADVVVTWAAGNAGGDGSSAIAVDDGDDARFLVVAAANWDAASVAASSSRGDRDDPSTWPHLSAVACHVVPLPYTQPGSTTGHASPYLDTIPQSCWTPDAAQRQEMVLGAYRMIDGTSFAAPSVAAVLTLMQQVHPGIRPADARAIVLDTTDVFLATTDSDGDGNVTRDEFWAQHGFEAGRGLLNATAAVAAAHYLALHPGASVDEVRACWKVGDEDGAVRLNPLSTCILPMPKASVPPADANATTEDAVTTASPQVEGRGKESTPAAPMLVVFGLALALRRRRQS